MTENDIADGCFIGNDGPFNGNAKNKEPHPMIDANETFNGTWPFKPNFTNSPGFRMHYIDEGNGEPILCLHGEPTWGYLYRNFIGPLSKNNRVVVPDHMGFGKSETPQTREYTLREHVANLTCLVEELDLTDITLVIQDWGGPIGGSLLATHTDRIKRVFVMNTIVYPFCNVAPWFDHFISNSDWFQFINTAAHEPVLLNLKYTVLSVMKLMSFYNMAAVNEDWIRAYAAPFETPEECIGGLNFPLDFADNGRFAYLEPPTTALAERVRAMPAMLACGMKDRGIPPVITLEMFKEAFGEQPIVELPNAGHFVQEDAPAELVALIQQFVQQS